MAVTGDTLTTYANALKTVYRDELYRAIPQRVKLLRMLKDKSKKVTTGGKSLTVTWGVEKQRNWGMNALTEGGDLATARQTAFSNYTSALAHYSFSGEVTGHLEVAGGKPDHSLAVAAAMKVKDEVQRMAEKLLGISIMMDGTAVLGQITAIATNTLTIGSTQINWFEIGMYLTVRDTASGGSEQLTSAQPASGLISAVDKANSTVTIADATGAAINDYVAWYDLYGQTLINGIRSLVDSAGTVQGVNRATAGNEFAEAQELSGASAALSEDLVIQLNDLIFKFAYGDEDESPEMFLTDADSMRWLGLAMVGRHRYTGNTKMVGGYACQEFLTDGGVRMIAKDSLAYPAEFLAIRPSDFGFVRPVGGDRGSGWHTDGGGNPVLLKPGSTAGGGWADAKMWTWKERLNLICDEMSCQAKLTTYVSP